MDKLEMSVYMKHGKDGSLSATWCVCKNGQALCVRDQKGSAKLKEKVILSTLEFAVQLKEAEGYVYQGLYMVSDQVEDKIANPEINSKPTTKPQAERLVFWNATGLAKPGWSQRVSEKLQTILPVKVVRTETSEKIEIEKMNYSIEITNSGGRGLIEKGNSDMLKFLVLVAAARESQVINIADDSMTSVSTSKFRKGSLHLQFDSSSYDDFMLKAEESGLVKTGAGAIMKGATTFF